MSATEQQTRSEEPTEARELRSATRPRTLERSFGLIAGILFIGGAFAGVPSSLLLDPAPPATLYLITLAGVALGLGAMVIPWDRISTRWAHVAMLFAIVQVGLTVALAGDPFVFYFVFIAIFAAYAFGERNVVAVYLGLIAIALLVPILVIPDSTRASAAQALAAIPAIVLVAVMVAFLRERLEDNRRTTRRFAREALALSVRIGRSPAAPEPAPAPDPRSRVTHPLLRRFAMGGSASLAVIAALGALAAAGVALPGPIERSFARVGIEHDHSSTALPRAQHLASRHRAVTSGSSSQSDPGDRPGRAVDPVAATSSADQVAKTADHSGGGTTTLGSGAAAPDDPSAAQPQSAPVDSGTSSSTTGNDGVPSTTTRTSPTAPPPAITTVQPPTHLTPPSVPHLGHQIQSTVGSLIGIGKHPDHK